STTMPLGALPAEVLADLVAECEHTFVRGGETVVHADERPDRAFVVVSGRLRVYAAPPASPRLVAELGPGQLFGEMALLSPGGRRATVVAGRDSELLCLGAEQFRRLVAHPDALMA